MAHASGKVILCGEHAVVYGCPALALGLERGVLAQSEPSTEPELLFGEGAPARGDTVLAYQALLRRLAAPPMRTRVELGLPPGVGLGASAAIAVAVARAVSDALAPGQEEDAEALLAAANAWEGVFHGNPSGVDTAAALAGGCIRFQKGKARERVPIAQSFELLVAVAGPASATRDMVASVARLRERNPERFAANLAAIEILVDNAERCLRVGDLPGLGQLLDYNQLLLSSWLVSTNELEAAIFSARRAGALGAKLTGAGGGGCVIALPPPGGGDAILAAWRAQGLDCFATRVSPHEDPETRLPASEPSRREPA